MPWKLNTGWKVKLMTNDFTVPDEMKKEQRWCAWFYEETDPGNVHERKKVPHNLNSSMCKGMASSTNPSTWGTYQQANNTYVFAKNNPQRTKEMHYGGPGFMFGDGWAFLDLDNIATVIANYSLGEHNLISDIMELLDYTYCEVSQSQEGLHFIFKLDNSVKQFTRKKHGCELYVKGRMAALTGNRLDIDRPLKITTINQQQWEQLHKLAFGDYSPTISTNDAFSGTELSQGVLSEQGLAVIDNIMKSTDATKFSWWLNADLPTVSTNVSGKQVPNWNGIMIDYDPSSQDQTCCNILAYWVKRTTGEYNSKLIDEIFKQTHLYRPKWDSKDGAGTYGQRTIQRAINYKSAQRNRYKVEFNIKGLKSEIG